LTVTKSTRAIHDRDDCLPERVELMQFWADKIDGLRDGKVTKKTKLERRGLTHGNSGRRRGLEAAIRSGKSPS
jgi:hypothetical protein